MTPREKRDKSGNLVIWDAPPAPDPPLMTPQEVRAAIEAVRSAIVEQRPDLAKRIRVNRATKDMHPDTRSVSVAGLTVYWVDLWNDPGREAESVINEFQDLERRRK